MAGKWIQHQKPMANMLLALILPGAMGVYTFGWRVAAVVALSCAVCYFVEWLFVRRQNKPVTLSAMVTGVLLALVLPPNVPFWMVVVGAAFCMVFGKMVFGGFGKNVFNPAMVGRCFLYISFPVAITGTWFGPADGPAGGFAAWTTRQKVTTLAEAPDAISSATPLTAAKRLNAEVVAANRGDADAALEMGPAEAAEHFDAIPALPLLTGQIGGSMGETSAIAILLALAYLLWRKTVQVSLVAGPALGMAAGVVVLSLTGENALPVSRSLLLNFLGGGTLFAITFMTTEPVSAPMDKRAKWIYGILIGVFAAVIRTMSVFNAGLMFSILLGNTFGPIIDHCCKEYADWRKARARKAEPAEGASA
jgi:Na+-transporting NADH:ubiquinone oxidoreductase subunit B